MRLRAANLACRRGGRDVFSGVSFSLGAGEALAVTGRNGAGKSSLLRTLVGLIRPAAGTIVLEGGERELTLAEQAHYLGHLDGHKGALTVAENLTFWCGFLGGQSRAGSGTSVAAALCAVGLDALADLPAAYLSAGQRRRLAIARLVAVRRPLWLLDEPMSALDAAAQQGLAGLMRAHLNDAGLILAATHGPLGIVADHTLTLGAAVALASGPPPQQDGEFAGSAAADARASDDSSLVGSSRA